MLFVCLFVVFRLLGYQQSARGGYVSVEVPPSDNETSSVVMMRGQAVTIMSSLILATI